MNKIFVSVIVASILILTGCKPVGSDPKTVLANFFNALEKKDFTAVKKYTTKDSEGMISFMQMGMENMGDKSNEMISYQKENMELGTAVIAGDKATVPVKDKKSGEITDFIIKKESGDWKVAFDKSSLLEMAQKKMKEHGFGDMSPEIRDSLEKIMDSPDKILKDSEK